MDVIGNALIQGTAGFNSNGETASFYLGDTNSEFRATYGGGTKFFLNGTERMELKGSSGDLDLKTGVLQINGNTVIDTNRDITPRNITASSTIQATSNSGANAAFQTPWQNDTIALQMKYDANYLMNIEFDAATRDLILTSSTNDNTANIRFRTSGSGASGVADRLIIDHLGRIGIGENNPVAKLAIKGANDTNFEIQPDISSGVNRITNFNRVSSAYKKLRVDASEHEFYRSGNPTVTFLSNGDLEIENGNLIVQNGHGIDFSDTGGPTHTGTGSSELLDDYEEGAFTPYPEAYYGNSVTFSGTFSGWYVKIGAKVTVAFKGDNFSFTSGNGGDLVGFRLPFNPTSGQSEGMGNIITNGWAASGRHLGTLLLSTTNAQVGAIGSNNNNGSWACMDFNTIGSGNTSFRAIFTYFVTN